MTWPRLIRKTPRGWYACDKAAPAPSSIVWTTAFGGADLALAV
jgi:hypothetical protein